MSEIIVRKASLDDLDEIANIEEKCFNVPWTKEALHYDMTTNSLSQYVVATFDEKVCGYIGFWKIAGDCNINNIAVLPEYRRLHAGTLILEYVFDLCRKEGIEGYTLEVRKSNEPAKNLYKKMGFEEAGIRKGYYQDNGEDAIIMWKTDNQE